MDAMGRIFQAGLPSSGRKSRSGIAFEEYSVVVSSKFRDALRINDAATHGSQFFDVLVLLIYSAGQEIISKIGEAISVLVAST